jgi:hypothetical protein
MSLAHPALNLIGKRRTKHKWASAEQKREHERLEAAWDKLKSQYAKPVSNKVVPLRKYKLEIPRGRDTLAHAKSVSTGIGVAAKKDIPQYTGTAMKGIGTLHKSNAVPVFTDEEAVDISRMRRG